MENNNKKAVVLAGGGARGSYEIGVWKALREIGYDYKIVTGCSVGSINGAMMVMGEFDKSVELWEIIETEKILDYDISGNPNTPGGLFSIITDVAGKVFKERGISAAPLKKVLEQFVDEEAMARSDVDYGITVTHLNGFKGKEVFFKDMRGKVADYIMASSAFYPVMQSYNIDGEEYIDGGYYNNVPTSMALEAEATELVVVDLKSVGLVRKVKIPPEIKTTVIATSWDLGALLMFSPHRAIRNIQLGYLDGLKAFGVLEGTKYTFKAGELRNKTDVIKQNIKILFERMKINLFYNSPDVLIKTAILLTLNKDVKSDFVMEDIVLFGAEIMGEILAVSPLEVYTFSDFDKFLYKNINEKNDGETDEKNELLLSEKELLDQLLGNFVTKGKKALFMRLYKIMSKNVYSDVDINVLGISARVSTTEFLGVLYGVASKILYEDLETENRNT